MTRYLLGFRNCVNFNGRISRKSYWLFILFGTIGFLITALIDNITGLAPEKLPCGLISLIYTILVFIPVLAATVRRLHDVNKNGILAMLAFIPVFGWIWLLALLVTETIALEDKSEAEQKENHNGHKTKYLNADTIIIIAFGWMFFFRAFYAISLRYVPEFYSSVTFLVANKFIGLIWACIPLALAFAIKEKPKRLILFIMGGIYLAYSLYTIILHLVKFLENYHAV